MTQFRTWVSGRHTRKVCLGCGYRGAELQREGEDAALVCPGCGQDLYARPPRSYAELEGFVDLPRRRPARPVVRAGAQRRPARRFFLWSWLARAWRGLTGRPKPTAAVSRRSGARPAAKKTV